MTETTEISITDVDTRRSAIANCTARHMWNVKCTSFSLGVNAFRPKFYGNGVIPCQNVDTVRQVVYCATTMSLKVFWRQNLQQTLFEISAKILWVSEPHSAEVRGDARPWLMARWKALVNFLFALIEPFHLFITVPELCGKMCTAQLFSRRGRSLCTRNFTWTKSFPINLSWHHKTRGTGLPDYEDYIPLHSLVLTQYRSVTDGRTDRRMDMP